MKAPKGQPRAQKYLKYFTSLLNCCQLKAGFTVTTGLATRPNSSWYVAMSIRWCALSLATRASKRDTRVQLHKTIPGRPVLDPGSRSMANATADLRVISLATSPLLRYMRTCQCNPLQVGVNHTLLHRLPRNTLKECVVMRFISKIQW